MSETLPNDPNSQTPPGESLPINSHQTIYAPESFRPLETADPETLQTSETAQTTSASKPAESEAAQPSPSGVETETENQQKEADEIVTEFEKLETAFRGANNQNEVLGDQIRVSISKIQEAVNRANPHEAGVEPIRRSVNSLVSAMEQNRFYGSIVAGDRELIPMPSFKDALREVLSRFTRVQDPTERQRAAAEAEGIIQDQIKKIESINEKQTQQEADRNALKDQIERAEKEAVDKEKQIVQVVNDGQPLPPDSISAVYSRLAKELANNIRSSFANPKPVSEILTTANTLLAKLHNLTSSQLPSPAAEPQPAATSSSPEMIASRPESAAQTSSETGPSQITSIQKEIIDRAVTDPDSLNRLKTIIDTFGTPEVKTYLNAKIASLNVNGSKSA